MRGCLLQALRLGHNAQRGAGILLPYFSDSARCFGALLVSALIRAGHTPVGAV